MIPTVDAGYSVRCDILDRMKLFYAAHGVLPAVLHLPRAQARLLIQHLRAECPQAHWSYAGLRRGDFLQLQCVVGAQFLELTRPDL